jgi:hypothetical protein
MSEFRPLFTSAAGIRHYMRTNADGSHTFAASQDTQAILDRNRAMATENDGYTKSREMRRVASIPYVLIQKWLHEEGWDALDPENVDRLARKLNDPDYAYLRTADGRLGVSDGVMR